MTVYASASSFLRESNLLKFPKEIHVRLVGGLFFPYMAVMIILYPLELASLVCINCGWVLWLSTLHNPSFQKTHMELGSG